MENKFNFSSFFYENDQKQRVCVCLTLLTENIDTTLILEQNGT